MDCLNFWSAQPWNSIWELLQVTKRVDIYDSSIKTTTPHMHRGVVKEAKGEEEREKEKEKEGKGERDLNN